MISWNAGTIPSAFMLRTCDRANSCTGRQRGWKKIGRVWEKKRKGKWSGRGKEITNEATEREQKGIKIEEKEEKIERKMQRFCVLFMW